MAAEKAVPYGRGTQKEPAGAGVNIVLITPRLGCGGGLVSITAGNQPPRGDRLLRGGPRLPQGHLHNPVLAYENGGDFLKFYTDAWQGKLDPFVLVVEGSIPNEKIKKEGYWAAVGTDDATGQPIRTTEWIDRLAPKALGVVAIGT